MQFVEIVETRDWMCLIGAYKAVLASLGRKRRNLTRFCEMTAGSLITGKWINHLLKTFLGGHAAPSTTYPRNMVDDKDCDHYQLEEHNLTLDTVKGQRNKLMSKSLRFSWAYYYTDICFSMRDDGQQKDGEQTK